MVSTTPAEVREVLDVSAEDYPDSSLTGEIAGAEALVREQLGGHISDEDLINRITTLVAADLAYPRVTGSASGREVSSVEQENSSITFTNGNRQASTGGASPHWQQAVRLDYTGRLEAKSVSFEVF